MVRFLSWNENLILTIYKLSAFQKSGKTKSIFCWEPFGIYCVFNLKRRRWKIINSMNSHPQHHEIACAEKLSLVCLAGFILFFLMSWAYSVWSLDCCSGNLDQHILQKITGEPVWNIYHLTFSFFWFEYKYTSLFPHSGEEQDGLLLVHILSQPVINCLSANRKSCYSSQGVRSSADPVSEQIWKTRSALSSFSEGLLTCNEAVCG